MNFRILEDGAPQITSLHESKFIQTYSWEKNFPHQAAHDWIKNNLFFAFCATIGYVCVIFGLKIFMRTRKPYELDYHLALWNWGLALFSFICLTRTAPELIYTLLGPNGHHNSLCDWSRFTYTSSFWAVVFGASKFVEFGDTIFIVLRKKTLIFLHWYHHAVTFLSGAFVLADAKSYGLWYIVLNSFVHSFMYSYFALNVYFKVSGIKMPRSWARMLTAMQLVQMFFGFWVNFYPVALKGVQGEVDCPRNPFMLKFCLAVAASYILLFGKFYYNSYVVKKAAIRRTNEQTSREHKNR